MQRLTFVFLFSVLILGADWAAAAPIYVYREADGSTRFTSKKPPEGTKYKIFTGAKTSFSVYRARSSATRRSYKLFKNAYSDIISKAAEQYSLDPHLLKAIIHVESAFNHKAVSPKGARGLMQLMPATAKDLGVKNAFVPDENIHGGARHLSRLIVKYNGNLRFALAAYNAGEEPVQRYNGVPPYAETQNYVRRVLELQKRYKQSVYG